VSAVLVPSMIISVSVPITEVLVIVVSVTRAVIV
jgi:hypothetical protein